MHHVNIVASHRLTYEQKLQTAYICFEGFAMKFAAFMLFENDAAKGADCLKDVINFDMGLFAVSNGSVLGYAGLDYNQKRYKRFSVRNMKKHYGVFGALWRTIINFFFVGVFKHVDKDELHIDSIAVSESFRGQGVGSALLLAVYDKAQSLGKKKITLEVVDTNPRAKKLYQRHGFAAKKTKRYGAITQSAGFTAVTDMEKAILCIDKKNCNHWQQH